MVEIDGIVVVGIAEDIEIRCFPTTQIHTIVQFFLCIRFVHRYKIYESAPLRRIGFRAQRVRSGGSRSAANIGGNPTGIATSVAHRRHFKRSELLDKGRICAIVFIRSGYHGISQGDALN